jgi:hypothetical protein
VITAADQFALWSGFDVKTDKAKDVARIDHFFKEGYESAISNRYPAIIDSQRFELLAPDRHGGFGAKYLTLHTWESLKAFDQDTRQPLELGGAAPSWDNGVEIRWAVTYRQFFETTAPVARPLAIYLAGVDPPPGTTEEDLAFFVDFYCGVHIPEVAARRGCSRASAHELDRVLVSPPEGVPLFLGDYEVVEESKVITKHIGFGYKKGPTVWEKHKTPWRLWYRRLAS